MHSHIQKCVCVKVEKSEYTLWLCQCRCPGSASVPRLCGMLPVGRMATQNLPPIFATSYEAMLISK
jgi:hypothetical protein